MVSGAARPLGWSTSISRGGPPRCKMNKGWEALLVGVCSVCGAEESVTVTPGKRPLAACRMETEQLDSRSIWEVDREGL